MPMPLAIPDPERIATTNAWAFHRALAPLSRPGKLGWADLAALVARAPGPARAAFDALAGPGPDSRPTWLLWADFRPADAVLAAGVPQAAWAGAAPDIARFAATAGDPLDQAARFGASVLILPAAALETLATRRPARADLAALRTLILIGGPASVGARIRALTWIKPDLLLLARAGNRFWGNPLDPVLDRPRPIPALFPPKPGR